MSECLVNLITHFSHSKEPLAYFSRHNFLVQDVILLLCTISDIYAIMFSFCLEAFVVILELLFLDRLSVCWNQRSAATVLNIPGDHFTTNCHSIFLKIHTHQTQILVVIAYLYNELSTTKVSTWSSSIKHWK